MADDDSPPPQRRVRASDKDRDDTLSVITEAVTNGRLDPEETAERQDDAIAAKFVDELMPLLDDLPEGEQLHRRFARPDRPRLGHRFLGPGFGPPTARALRTLAHRRTGLGPTDELCGHHVRS